MLTSLRIQNLALIDDLEITLGPGLTVLTGETGAGKSIIVGAVGLILGDRATADLVRQGHEEGSVEVLFDVHASGPAREHLDSLGLVDEDGQLVARRVLTRSGKSRAYLGGRLSTLGELRRAVAPLLDVSSQHAHTSLLDITVHRTILDRFGELGAIVTEYTTEFEGWRAAESAHKELLAATRGRSERIDLLRFQLGEIDAVGPKAGEDVALEEELAVLRHATDLRNASGVVEDKLYSRRGAITDQLAELERVLRGAAIKDPALAGLAARLESARLDLEDIGQEVRQYRSRVNADPGRLDIAEDRLAALEKLNRRFGPSVDDVIRRAKEIAGELADLEGFDDRALELEKSSKAARTRAGAASLKLREARKRVAKRVETRIEAELHDLGIPHARFNVSITPSEGLLPHGADDIEFLLSSNVGESPMPLAKIASGGELSRIMLALKHVLAEAEPVELYVFDEVDTGVSGAVGERIGLKLFETARKRQALCITHLPQVACHADMQLRVHKAVEGGRTVTRVDRLDHAGRREELARLLAGVEVTAVARAHAAELLDRALAAHG